MNLTRLWACSISTLENSASRSSSDLHVGGGGGGGGCFFALITTRHALGARAVKLVHVGVECRTFQIREFVVSRNIRIVRHFRFGVRSSADLTSYVQTLRKNVSFTQRLLAPPTAQHDFLFAGNGFDEIPR